jgi:hypothetical protein
MPDIKKPITASNFDSLDRIAFGPPPLLEGEDSKAYDELLAGVSGGVHPADLFEEIWVREIVDHTWEAWRWRRLKTVLLEETMPKALERLLWRPAEFFYCEDEDEGGGIGVNQVPAKELAKGWAAKDPAGVKQVEELLASAGQTIETVKARALEIALNSIERIDRLTMAAENRRDAILREI